MWTRGTSAVAGAIERGGGTLSAVAGSSGVTVSGAGSGDVGRWTARWRAINAVASVSYQAVGGNRRRARR